MDVKVHWYVNEPRKPRGGPYVARLALVGTIACGDWRKRDELRAHLRASAEAAMPKVHELLTPCLAGGRTPSWTWSVDGADVDSWTDLDRGSDHMLSVRWAIVLQFDRPKDMPADVNATLACLNLANHDDEGAFGPVVRSVVDAGIAAAADAERRERELRWANRIVDHYASTVRKAAKDACRYEQRLAALQAEYVAEKAAQAAKLVAEHDGSVRFTDSEEPVPAHVVRAALSALPNAVRYEPDLFHHDSPHVTAEALAECESEAG